MKTLSPYQKRIFNGEPTIAVKGQIIRNPEPKEYDASDLFLFVIDIIKHRQITTILAAETCSYKPTATRHKIEILTPTLI